MIEVLFFGRMADVMQTRSLKVAADGVTLTGLRDRLFADARDKVRFEAIQMSVNQQVTREDQFLKDGDEVAFFSVFSGG